MTEDMHEERLQTVEALGNSFVSLKYSCFGLSLFPYNYDIRFAWLKCL